MANNFIANRYAQHRSDMVANLYDGAPALLERTQGLTQHFVSTAGMDLTTATTKAYAMISSAVDRQAYYLSYLDTFRLITIFFVAVIPLVAFLRVKKQAPQHKAAAVAAMAEAH